MLSEGRISLKVMTEVSELSNENAIQLVQGTSTQTIPAIKTRRAETTVEIPSGGALAMAGMIQEQTKQQISGLPGLMQVPVLGTLFKSRDYVNRQTELMVIVTPYIARAVAQKDLSRPDDGFADSSDPAADPARPPEPHLRRARRQGPGAGLSRQVRLHSRLTDATRTPMKKLPIVARALAFASLAALLVGCKTTSTQSEITGSVPNDYRQRHPIAVREGKQTLTVFIGDRRGGLTAVAARRGRRARAGLAARGDRRLRHRGSGRQRERARRDERRARDPRGARRAPACRSIRSRCGPIAPTIRPGSAPSASTIRRCWPRPARAACGPTTSARPSTRPTSANRPYWNLGCATQRNLAAQVDNPADLVQPRAETPALTSRRATALDKYRKGEPTATQYPDANKGKISDVGQ